MSRPSKLSKREREDVRNSKICHNEKEKIFVDIVGRNPDDSHFHGIKQLLMQLFLRAQVNVTELTNFIISQNYGAVLQQDLGSEEEDDDDDDNDDDSNNILGITTVINLSDNQDTVCVKQLRQLLLDLSNEYGTEKSKVFIRKLIKDDSSCLALIINERFINIPPQVSEPVLKSLICDMSKACKNTGAFNYLVFICKLHKPKADNKDEVIWSNPEEEIIDEEAECRFEFSVKKDADSAVCGKWTEEDLEMIPYRRVLIVDANKLNDILQKIIVAIKE